MKTCCNVNNTRVEIPDNISDEVAAAGGLNAIAAQLPGKTIMQMARLMRALADERRLRMLYGLSQQRMCVCMLASLTDCSYSRCSYHVAKLHDAGLIEGSRQGTYVVYSLTELGRQMIDAFNTIQEMKG